MVVVFSFLLLLIISVNLLRIVFSSEAQGTELTVPKNPKNDVHQKIIKEVFEGIRS
jgi:Na+-transporting methylmalonyl-CoA/oxaloacetate decarboxylase gamma subunit